MEKLTVKFLSGDLFTIEVPTPLTHQQKYDFMRISIYFLISNNIDILLSEQIKLEENKEDDKNYYAFVDTLDAIDTNKIFYYLTSYGQNNIWILLTKYLQYLSDRNLIILYIGNDSTYKIIFLDNNKDSPISIINIPNFSEHRIEIEDNKITCRYPFFNNVIGLFIVETIFDKQFIIDIDIDI